MALRFKSLLLENEKTELLQTLRTGDYYGVQRNKRFFRGEKKEDVEKFKRIKIEPRPNPKDTTVLVDEIVESIRKEHYPEVASRQKSLFVTGKSNVARGYGEETYVFVPKTANAWWSPNDAYTDFFFDVDVEFGYAEKWVKYKESEGADLPPHPIVAFAIAIKEDDVERAARIASSIYFDVVNEEIEEEFDTLTGRIKRGMALIYQYFESLNEYKGDIDSRYIYELIVEGDHVLLASKNWFNSNIEPELYR